jgi:hypothetical protein
MSLFYCDAGYLNIYIAGQPAYLYGFARRRFLRKAFAINSIYLREGEHVFEEDGALDHVAKVHAGGAKHLGQVEHNLFSLFFNGARNHVARRPLYRNLAAYIKCIAGLYGLAVRANGLGGVGRINYFF